MENFELIKKNVDILPMQKEIELNKELWEIKTLREKLNDQKETKSIFLRGLVVPKGFIVSSFPNNIHWNIHSSGKTVFAHLFPATYTFVDDFAKETSGVLSRVTLAKLKPGGRVGRHFDRGDYYKVRNRHHLVVQSEGKSILAVENEEVTMKEGELWWFDNKKFHYAHNKGTKDRIHLIFDIKPKYLGKISFSFFDYVRDSYTIYKFFKYKNKKT